MNSKVILFVVLVALTGFIACKKSGDQAPTTITNEISLINATGDTLNVYENGTRVNSGSNLLPSGQYTDLQIIAGTQRYQFKKAGNPNTLFETELTLDTPFAYTVFVAGQSSDKVFAIKGSDTLKVTDTTAHIRYINASPDAGDISFTISTYPTVAGVTFKSATSFVSVPKGLVYYSMVRPDGSILASGNLTLSAGVSYNLFSKGLVAGKGTSALGARILTAQ
ncbi:DUF4397 domain-containing protein [Mucilaginibacter ximonensis]|uniref:DUF4397 domain-containing protein n=1 Tax=Mucilaginibacter ximonensis TaxID=538021 RepID=A0ABW5YET7_9SPHI